MRATYIVLSAVILAVVALAAAAFVRVNVNGLSTREAPTRAEQVLARATRRWVTPGKMRGSANPVAFSPEVWTEARAHFADHCAVCHANDGSGDTEIGRNLYPKAPDMRLPPTQLLTDGELYWIIENGVRLTGMPAWGAGGPDDLDTWKLVHFIRRLKDLTPEQIREMAALNPKTPAEIQEELDDRKFLSGQDPDPGPVHVLPHH
jgi:mono/diheme cytochrome c family protein